MNQTTATSTPGASLIPDGTTVITTMHFAILAVLGVMALAAIIWGIRAKRRRRAADRVIEEHNESVIAAGDPVARVAPEPDAEPVPVPEPEPAPISVPAERPQPIADERIAPTPVVSAAPAPPAAVQTGYASAPVTMLKGLGPKVAARLAELGITTIGQLAALDDDRAATLDAQLGAFAGRMERDRWLEQARFLAADDKPGFEAVFGKL